MKKGEWYRNFGQIKVIFRHSVKECVGQREETLDMMPLDRFRLVLHLDASIDLKEIVSLKKYWIDHLTEMVSDGCRTE